MGISSLEGNWWLTTNRIKSKEVQPLLQVHKADGLIYMIYKILLVQIETGMQICSELTEKVSGFEQKFNL
jgi:hypothetical protein